MESIKNLRSQIDQSDEAILRALAARRKLTDRALRAKTGWESLRDVKREEQVLDRVSKLGKKLGLDPRFLARVFHEIIDDSLRAQRLAQLDKSHPGRRDVIRVAFQGIEGAYSQLAAYKFFSKEIEKTVFAGCQTFDDIIRAVEEGRADYALLPIENTTAGSINQAYELLAETSLSIVGEEILRIDHCLLALKNVPVYKIRRILSHPQALAQCGKFLAKLENCQTESYADTAMAVRKVREDQDSAQAAIASEDAGRRYGLKVVARGLADRRDNYTRFLVVSKKPAKIAGKTRCKTSLILATKHEEGALLKALDIFHRYKINLTKLESRPRPRSPFQYLFYLDFEGNAGAANIRSALKELKKRTSLLKILGCYPAGKISTNLS
jgi:chorismate mutase/prephenate dehydratase